MLHYCLDVTFTLWDGLKNHPLRVPLQNHPFHFSRWFAKPSSSGFNLFGSIAKPPSRGSFIYWGGFATPPPIVSGLQAGSAYAIQ